MSLYDEKLKHHFLLAVTALMKEAPEDLQKQWDGNIVWKMDQPHLSPNDVQFKFRDKLHDDFNRLLVRLSNRDLNKIIYPFE